MLHLLGRVVDGAKFAGVGPVVARRSLELGLRREVKPEGREAVGFEQSRRRKQDPVGQHVGVVVPLQQKVHTDQAGREVFQEIFALCIGLSLSVDPLAPRLPLHIDGDVLEPLAVFIHHATAENGRVLRRGARHGVDELVRPNHTLLGRCEVQTVGKTKQRDHDDQHGDGARHGVQPFGFGEHHGVAAGEGQAGSDFRRQPIVVVPFGRERCRFIHALS